MFTEQMIEAFCFNDDYQTVWYQNVTGTLPQFTENKSRLKAYYTTKAIPETSAEDAISEWQKVIAEMHWHYTARTFINRVLK